MFSRRTERGYGLLVDVGSGSVGLVICAPDGSAVWTHREHAPLTTTDSSKAITTAIMSVMMTFEGEGRAALAQHNKSATILSIQATVSAPWSYTVARTINFEKDEPFVITQELLGELASAAAEQAMADFESEHSLKELGVQESSRTVLDTHANGYRVTTLNKQKATQLSVTHVSTLIRTEIMDTLHEMQAKLFARAPLQTTSYMLANYYVVDELQPAGVDFCLVDITNEATELGIIRHNALQYSTHVSFGRTSLAREVSDATKVPLAEAFTSLRTLHEAEDTHPDITAALEAYQAHIVELFKETGDRLTIPKHIYLQADAGLADFFAPIVESAGKEASKSSVLVTPLAPDMLRPNKQNASVTDTAALVACRFFHTNQSRTFFEYL